MFSSGDKVKILKGIYIDYEATIIRWLHDELYIAEVENPNGEKIEIILCADRGEMARI